MRARSRAIAKPDWLLQLVADHAQELLAVRHIVRPHLLSGFPAPVRSGTMTSTGLAVAQKPELGILVFQH
jgi:hypothetical protein